MPSCRPKSCRVCGRHELEAGRISWRGYCAEHGEQVMLESHRQIRDHSGPRFRHWRERMAASVGGRLMDERRDAE